MASKVFTTKEVTDAMATSHYLEKSFRLVDRARVWPGAVFVFWRHVAIYNNALPVLSCREMLTN